MLTIPMLLGCIDYQITNPDDEVIEPIEEEETIVDPIVEDEEPDEPVAEAPVYANTSTELYEVEPVSGETLHVGSFHDAEGAAVENFIDIAIDLSGRMYGGTFTSLYSINPTTAEVRWVCDLDVDMTALTFTSEGVLFAGGEDEVTEIDVDHCAVSSLLSQAPYETSGDLVGLPDGYLYWTVRGDGDSGMDELVRIDPNSGFTQYVGVIAASKLFGLGYHEGQLYGFSKFGEIVRISPSEADSEVTSVDESIGWWGATTNPVVW